MMVQVVVHGIRSGGGQKLPDDPDQPKRPPEKPEPPPNKIPLEAKTTSVGGPLSPPGGGGGGSSGPITTLPAPQPSADANLNILLKFNNISNDINIDDAIAL